MRKMFLALFFLATSLTAGASLAEDKPADLTPAQQAEARLTLETARNLISYGETKNDALALVVGAKLLASAPGRVLADNQKGEGGADKATNFDIETVLKKAEDLAQGNELILQVAKEVRETAAANSKAICYWEYYCYYNGWCEYYYACW
jgi:hypothetical protein